LRGASGSLGFQKFNALSQEWRIDLEISTNLVYFVQ
jgi:hypothetical protein